jgi:hypothetical protein
MGSLYRPVRAGAVVMGGELGSSLYRLLEGGQGRLELAPVAHLLLGTHPLQRFLARAMDRAGASAA